MHTLTTSYAILPISREAYQEIKARLEEAGYAHHIHDNRIDMTGLAVAIEKDYKIRESYRG